MRQPCATMRLRAVKQYTSVLLHSCRPIQSTPDWPGQGAVCSQGLFPWQTLQRRHGQSGVLPQGEPLGTRLLRCIRLKGNHPSGANASCSQMPSDSLNGSSRVKQYTSALSPTHCVRPARGSQSSDSNAILASARRAVAQRNCPVAGVGLSPQPCGTGIHRIDVLIDRACRRRRAGACRAWSSGIAHICALAVAGDRGDARTRAVFAAQSGVCYCCWRFASG